MEHSFSYEKGRITVSGVLSLDGFEDKEAKIKIEGNSLIFKGTDFVLKDMAQDSGRVCFTGKLTSIEYTTKADKIPLLKRIFK